MPSVSNDDAEQCLREILKSEGYRLTPKRNHGETGVDVIASKSKDKFYIEVIGYHQSGPSRSKAFYAAFFSAIYPDWMTAQKTA